MASIKNLRTYAELREFVSPGAFTSAMNFLAWHNRLKMTHMLEPWKALVVAFASETRPPDPLQYPALKSFCTSSLTEVPATVEECRELGARLESFLQGQDE
jgi:hypothetical protein